MEYRKFFYDKKVLITGHTGFVGSWMAMVLDYFNASVAGLSLMCEKDSLYKLINQEGFKVESYISDIRDSESLNVLINQISPDIIVHLAAYGFVKECFLDPKEAFSTNIGGTVNLMDAIRNCPSVKYVLVVTSDKVYKNESQSKAPMRESDSLGIGDPYSCSKTCEDLITQCYYENYLKAKGIKVSIVRPGNILGGGDHVKTRLIPSLLASFEDKRNIYIRHPNAIRPWQYILDAIDAYIYIIYRTYSKLSDEIHIYNVGPEYDKQISVGEIVHYLSEKFKTSTINYENVEEDIKEAKQLSINIDKINNLGWYPKYDIYKILDKIYDFWEKSKTENLLEVCRTLIKEYY